MVKQAVILASGLGSRLKSNHSQEPKPLMRVGGIPLLSRVIYLMKNAGIEHIVVVVGYKKNIIKDFLKKHHPEVVTADNDEYRKNNGISLIKAKEKLISNEPFLLTMSDHIFDNNFVIDFLEKAEDMLSDNDAVLAVDNNIDDCFDFDDATKLFIDNGKITHIGKELNACNSIDTGLFLCNHIVFIDLIKIYEKQEDVSISEGMSARSAEKRFAACDMSGRLWQDIDTPSMKTEAEKRILASKDNIKSNYFWDRFINSSSDKLLMSIFHSEFDYLPILDILFFLPYIIFTATAIRLESSLFSSVVFFATLIFIKIKRKLVNINPQPQPITSSISKIPIPPMLLSISMLPVFLNTPFIIGGFLILSAAFLLLMPTLKTMLNITLPDIQLKQNILPFFSLSLFSIVFFITALLKISPIIISLLFIFVLGTNILCSNDKY